MDEYKGEERRESERDHDLLTKIDANLSNFMKRFDDHIDDDTNNFSSVRQDVAELKKDVAELKKYLFMGLGIIAFVAFVAKFKWGS